MIAEEKLDFIVFFWDPMEAQPHDSDVKALLRLAVAWNILIACNRTTADFILTSLLMQEEYTIELPDYTGYLKRKVF
jgi:methylglyoxal synthase